MKSRTSLTMLTAFLRRESMSLEIRRRSATSSVSRINSPVRSSLYSVDTSSFCRTGTAGTHQKVGVSMYIRQTESTYAPTHTHLSLPEGTGHVQKFAQSNTCSHDGELAMARTNKAKATPIKRPQEISRKNNQARMCCRATHIIDVRE